MRNGLLTTLVTMTALAGPAAAHAQLGDPVPVRLGFSPATIDPLIADEGHRPAFFDGSAVAHQDANGRWRRFGIVVDNGVALTPVEGGGGLVVWGERGTIRARRWHRDGRVDQPVTVLTGIADLQYFSRSGNYVKQWRLASDGAGTVAIAGPAAPERAAGAVYAAVRAPGSGFGPQQQVLPPDPAPPYPYNTDTLATVIPSLNAGAATVTWQRYGTVGLYGAGHVVRAAGASTFGPPSEASVTPRAADELLTSDLRVIKVAGDVAALCARFEAPCGAPRLFEWRGARAMIAVSTDSGTWLARQRSDGRFANPRFAARAAGEPVWTARPGRIEFWRLAGRDHSGRNGGLFRFPFGVRARRAPRVLLDDARGSWDPNALSIDAHCDNTCRLSADVRRLQDSGVTGPTRRAEGRRRGPFEPDTLTFDGVSANAQRLRVTITARGTGGRSRTTAVLRRDTERERWVIASTTTRG
jgi:hypothetical protein